MVINETIKEFETRTGCQDVMEKCCLDYKLNVIHCRYVGHCEFKYDSKCSYFKELGDEVTRRLRLYEDNTYKGQQTSEKMVG